jgi:hypothetical protein
MYRSGWWGISCTALVFASASLAHGAGAATAKTTNCASYKGGAAGLVIRFTNIKSLNVPCSRAHEVLGTFANSGPSPAYLGYACHATKTKIKSVDHVTCTETKDEITATETTS